ncbi:MAG: hypothetical protein KF732_04700 [Flavobacteriales bacterium]|nr:hypothetical protein [Flavobacteriales bacterium]
MFKYFLITIFIFSSFLGKSENNEPTNKKSNKGRMYAFWGWNREWYTNSDIHFTGKNYNFTLSDVEATDRQSKFNVNPYFNLGNLTIPQTNLRVGYFISDKYDISIGYDHMKYVMKNFQTVKINGNIHSETPFDNQFINDEILLDYNFLMFEHTDGLNYINTEITRNDDLLTYLKATINPNKLKIHTLLGFGTGIMLPRSNVLLFNGTRYDEFHLAGFGISAKAGVDVILFKYFLLRSEYRTGFIGMPSIRTTPNKEDNASQSFFFSQINICFGFTLYPFQK